MRSNRTKETRAKIHIRTGVILTRRLALKPFIKKYISKNYVGWLNNPLVVRFSEQRHKTHNMESCKSYVKSFRNSPDCLWAIFLNNGMHIGNISASIDEFNSVADIALLIGETSEWGNGYGLEACKAVCDFLMDKGIRKITIGTMKKNVGMIHVMKKLGMTFDGCRKKQFMFENEEVDMVQMAIFNKNYLRLHKLGMTN